MTPHCQGHQGHVGHPGHQGHRPNTVCFVIQVIINDDKVLSFLRVHSQEEKEESSSGEQTGCGLGHSSGSSGEKSSGANFVQTIQCDVTLKVNETIKVILRRI